MLLKNKSVRHWDDVSRIFIQVRKSLGLTAKEVGIALGEKRGNAEKFVTDIETCKTDVQIETLHNLTKLYCELKVYQKTWLDKLKGKLIK